MSIENSADQNPEQPIRQEAIEMMSEQKTILRQAFQENQANALGVIEAELRFNQKVIDGHHFDPRLKTPQAIAEAKYFPAEYQKLKDEFANAMS